MKPTIKAEVVSITLSSIMAAGMIAVSLTTHSIAILAEGTDTIIDVVASVAVLAGLSLAGRKTRTFPSGLYKVENIVATAIGVLILVSAYELGRESIDRLIHGGRKLDDPWLMIGVMSAALAITVFIAWYKGHVGKRENSPSLRADARHSWTDAAACCAIILGVGLEFAGVPDMDAYTALVVVAVLAWSGVEVVIEGVKVLLDASIEKDLLEKVTAIAESNPGVREVLGVVGRNSGSYRFLELSVLPVEYDLRTDERLTHELKSAIRTGIEKVDEVIVDLGVPRGNAVMCAVPLAGDGENLAVSLEEAGPIMFMELDGTTGEAVSGRRLEPPLPPDIPSRGVRLAVFLARHGTEVLVTRDTNLESNPYYLLDANGVEVVRTPDARDLSAAGRALEAHLGT